VLGEAFGPSALYFQIIICSVPYRVRFASAFVVPPQAGSFLAALQAPQPFAGVSLFGFWYIFIGK
jgi:hypothetical protein